MNKNKKLISSGLGVLLFAFGLNMLIDANLGLTPLDSFSLLVSQNLHINYGNAMLAVHLITLSFVVIFKKQFHESTDKILLSFVSIFLISRVVNFMNIDFEFYNYLNQYIIFVIGLILLSFGTALILFSDLIITPTDKLVDCLAILRKKEVGIVKIEFEIIFLITNFLITNMFKLQSTLSMYTIVLAVSLGLLIELYDKLIFDKYR